MQLLKQDWERFAHPIPVDKVMATALLSPYTRDPIQNITLLSQGCVNSNYKVTFDSNRSPLVLRLFVRNPDSLAIEMALQKNLLKKLPIAKILYADSSCQLTPYPYALMEWVEGELMRDVILSQNQTAIAECAFAAGKILDQLRQIAFEVRGFFKPDLTIVPFAKESEFLSFTNTCLTDTLILNELGLALAVKIKQYIATHQSLLSDIKGAHLTHADFDPTNILVKKVNAKYEIAALLDWEFALADSYFLDMGIFLRYRNRLPACYEDAFIQGLQSEGLVLPKNWKILSNLMDILCMLSMLYDNRSIDRPLMKQDVKSLLSHCVT
jgi:aminoglycoside phosphotransferase (APT) family kinase protein